MDTLYQNQMVKGNQMQKSTLLALAIFLFSQYSPTKAQTPDAQEKCFQIANTILAEQKLSIERDISLASKTIPPEDNRKLELSRQQNHFNNRSKKCYVIIEISTNQNVVRFNNRSHYFTSYLFDGYENRIIAMCVLHNGEQSGIKSKYVSSCGIQNATQRGFIKLFSSLDEYFEFTATYLTE